jgi:hypothetical protein
MADWKTESVQNRFVRPRYLNMLEIRFAWPTDNNKFT